MILIHTTFTCYFLYLLVINSYYNCCRSFFKAVISVQCTYLCGLCGYVSKKKFHLLQENLLVTSHVWETHWNFIATVTVNFGLIDFDDLILSGGCKNSKNLFFIQSHQVSRTRRNRSFEMWRNEYVHWTPILFLKKNTSLWTTLKFFRNLKRCFLHFF